MDDFKPRTVAESTMRADLRPSQYEETSANGGDQRYALALATVLQVDSENQQVSLRIETGETFQTASTPLSFAGGGKRVFLGALPEVGDVCIVGWAMGESGRTRLPYVLAWLPPQPTGGYDWWPVQNVAPDEWGMSAKERAEWEGVLGRYRLKRRHMQPGNVVGSSAQGADLILDESVTLSSRRGQELILRDQDQALVIRSAQEFHALAGARMYAGMVQRDATLLPSLVQSDGIKWDADEQVDAQGQALSAYALAQDAAGTYLPAPVFQSEIPFPGNLNPLEFLVKGSFIDTRGNLTPAVVPDDGVYGGKSIYRVSSTGGNAASNALDALVEYRWEISHTSDGTLPVTEQTDGYDADGIAQRPHVEWVLGSVVGNDAFSPGSRSSYGQPLLPQVFAGSAVAPNMLPAGAAPLGAHAATLLQVHSVVDPTVSPTFFSVTKSGRYLWSIAPQGPGLASVEGSLGSGARLASEGPVSLLAQGFVQLAGRGDPQTNVGLDLQAVQSAVRIVGGGSALVPGARPPAVSIEAATHMLLRAAQSITLQSPELNLVDLATAVLQATNTLDLQAGDRISLSSKQRSEVTFGKATQQFGGPLDGSPSNGPLRETQFTGTPASGASGVVDQYKVAYGDRFEEFEQGDHETSMLVGNLTYRTQQGQWLAQAGQNSLAVGMTGMTGTVNSGDMSFSSTGSATLSGAVAATLSSQATATVRGAVVVLSSTGGKVGGIVSGADLDPLTGMPLSTLGMGSPTQLLG